MRLFEPVTVAANSRAPDEERNAGKLHNEPDNLILWLRLPQSVVPGNAMPDMNLSERDARDIAAYLYDSSRP